MKKSHKTQYKLFKRDYHALSDRVMGLFYFTDRVEVVEAFISLLDEEIIKDQLYEDLIISMINSIKA